MRGPDSVRRALLLCPVGAHREDELAVAMAGAGALALLGDRVVAAVPTARAARDTQPHSDSASMKARCRSSLQPLRRRLRRGTGSNGTGHSPDGSTSPRTATGGMSDSTLPLKRSASISAEVGRRFAGAGVQPSCRERAGTGSDSTGSFAAICPPGRRGQTSYLKLGGVGQREIKGLVVEGSYRAARNDDRGEGLQTPQRLSSTLF